MARAQKTLPTDVDPVAFVDALATERRRREGHELLALFGDATGAPAVMWGSTMVGYGEEAYRYDSGHSGTAFRVGFSPRAAAISLYGVRGAPRSAQLLDALGPHRTGASCVYVTSLARIDVEVLRELVREAWA